METELINKIFEIIRKAEDEISAISGKHMTLKLLNGHPIFKPDYNDIIRRVSDMNKVTVEDIKSKSRKREIVEARNISIIIIKDNFPRMSQKTLGKIFGRDHSTVSSSIEKHNDWIEFDLDYRYRFEMSKKEVEKMKV